MSRYFETVTEKYRDKYWSNGYFAALAKKKKRSGILALIFCIPILAVITLGCGAVTVVGAQSWIKDNDESAIGMTIVLLIVTLAMLALVIFLVKLLWQNVKSTDDSCFRECLEFSDYPENVIRDSEHELLYGQNVTRFSLAPSKGYDSGFLTEHYLIKNPPCCCVIKREDITGAYLVNIPYDYYNKRYRKVSIDQIHLAVFSNHHTVIELMAKKKRAKELIAMLQEKNPNIDTDNGRVWSEEEYQKRHQTCHPYVDWAKKKENEE